MSMVHSGGALPATGRGSSEIVARERVRRPVTPTLPPSGDGDVSSAPSSLDASRSSLPVDNTPVSAAPVSAERDYEIGYRKPPKHSQFRKGQSGNPMGRPKGAKGMKVLVRELLTQKVVVRTSGGSMKMTKMQAMLHKLSEKAFAGDIRALQSLITYYASSVPDEPARAQADAAQAETIEDMDAHDLAILEALRATLMNEPGEGS